MVSFITFNVMLKTCNRFSWVLTSLELCRSLSGTTPPDGTLAENNSGGQDRDTVNRQRGHLPAHFAMRTADFN
jgi:hypothetical protein